METQQIIIDKDRARQLYQEYRAHQHYSTPIDREIQRAYRLIAQGRVVIRAIESIAAAGLNEQRLPKLAIARADATECFLDHADRDRIRFASRQWVRNDQTRSYIDLPAGSLPDIQQYGRASNWRRYSAIVPLIPIHLRPRQALGEYHILFEAEWRRVVPRDPMLLRRIGGADLWLVVAAWDLTEVELAALSTRVTPQ